MKLVLKSGLFGVALLASAISLAQDKDINEVNSNGNGVAASVSKEAATPEASTPDQETAKNAAKPESSSPEPTAAKNPEAAKSTTTPEALTPNQETAKNAVMPEASTPNPETVKNTATPKASSSEPETAQNTATPEASTPNQETAKNTATPEASVKTEASSPDQKKTTAAPTVSLIPADAATATVLAQQRRVDRLSTHIQDRYDLTPEKARSIVNAAIRSAETHQLEPELLLAIIAVESTFNERAVSRVGARGLMQVMPGPHSDKLREIGGRQALFDPAKNIHTGALILVSYLNDQPGNLRRALLRYNGSLNRPRSSYPEKVMRIYRDFQRAATLETVASTVQG